MHSYINAKIIVKLHVVGVSIVQQLGDYTMETPSPADDRNQRKRFCPVCEAETTVRVTVPWQDDLCRGCHNSIPGTSVQPDQF